jgi:hypothetical protein
VGLNVTQTVARGDQQTTKSSQVVPLNSTESISSGDMSVKRLLFLILLSVTPVLYAQEKDAEREKRYQQEAAKGLDTTKFVGWKYSAATGANLSQMAFRDWAQGGANSLAYALWGAGTAVKFGENTRWSNRLKVMFGQARVGDQEVRKTDDEIYFESLFIYFVGSTINPYGSFTLRTQIGPGYEYPTGAEKVQISNFFDPASLTQSAGVAYTPFTNLTIRLGAGAREMLTTTYNQYADDPATLAIEKTRVEGGFESVTDFRWPFAENMSFVTRLEMFAPFKNLDRVFVRNDNTIAMKVNQLVTVNFNVQFINDVDVSPRTQVKEALAIGISYTLL